VGLTRQRPHTLSLLVLVATLVLPVLPTTYVHPERGQVGLRLGRYDQRLPLTIDPVLRYSGYLGGSAADAATADALDTHGNLYLTGYTASPDYPATNGFTTTAAGATYDAYVTELSRTGAVSYSDYLGGSGSDAGWGIAVDTQGNAYVTGQTSSGDFPTTPYTVSLTTGASSGTCPGLTGLLGGALGLSLACPVSYTVQTGPALTATANLSVTLPATGTDAFVVKVSADGGSIGYSERLGSLGGLNAIGDTWGRAIAVDGQGNAYVTGQTDSPDFPVTTLSPIGITNTASLVHGVCNPLTGLNTGTLTQAITTTGGLCYDAFVTKLSPSYQGLNGRILYSTYLGGGRDDYGYGIATDGQGNAYVTGRTDSPDFPTTTGGNLDRAAGTGGLLGTATYPACHETSCPDAFAARLDTTAGGLISVPPAVWQLTGPVIAGVTSGAGGLLSLPITGTAGTIVNKASLTWSRFLGGSGADEGTAVALDPSGNVYVAGDTAPLTTGTTGDFPTTTGAYSTTAPAGTCPTGPCADAFVAKLSNTSSANSQTNGQLMYASRVGGGGDDRAAALAVDTAGHAYIVGSTSSADYPLIGSLQGFAGTQTGSVTTTMAFVTKLNIQGSALWYSSYLGGSGGDAGSAVAVDGIGDVALAGTTGSTDVLSLRPVARQELATQPTQTRLNGSQGQPDAFVATIDATTRYLTYGYDNVDRLTGVTETLGNAYGYSYDPAGNRTDAYLNGVAVQHSQYDGANEAITVTTPRGATIDSYDAAGNLTVDGTNSYRYDPLNRLIALTPSGEAGATGQRAQPETYAYNGDGTLVAQTGNVAQTGSSAVTTRYTQDLAVQPSAPGANGGPSTGLYAPTGHTPPPSQVLQARVTQSSGGDLVTDYAYGVDTQGNPSRFASNPLGNGAHTWSVADLQGSPRYTQDDTGQPTNAGTPSGTLNYDPQPTRYDPYGAIDRGADGNGQVPQTFGYRGELQDANTGLVNLRARTYNPATGQFLTRDPLEQQTGQAYAYADGNPIANADPSGQDYQATNLADLPAGVEDTLVQRIKNTFAASAQRDTRGQPYTILNYHAVGVPDTLPQEQSHSGPAPSVDIVDLSGRVETRQTGIGPVRGADGLVYDIVPAVNQLSGVLHQPPPGTACAVAPNGPHSYPSGVCPPSYTYQYHSYTDAGIRGVTSRPQLLALEAADEAQVIDSAGKYATRAFAFTCATGNGQTSGYLYLARGYGYPRHATLPSPNQPGGGDPRVINPMPQLIAAIVNGVSYAIFATNTYEPATPDGNGGGFIQFTVCQYQQGPGNRPCEQPMQNMGPPPTYACQSETVLQCGYQFFVGDDFNTLTANEPGLAGVFHRTVAILDLVSNVALIVPIVGEGARGLVKGAAIGLTGAKRLAAAVVGHGAVEGDFKALEEVGLQYSEGTLQDLKRGVQEQHGTEKPDERLNTSPDDGGLSPACPFHCFPAGTRVATPYGHVSIEKLHIGDLVLAEDPTTGKVEAEPVQAVIVRAKSDLMAVDLSDDSTLKVTTNHLFWVDAGPHREHAGWVLSGQLRQGDRLRTTAGRHVLVMRVRRHVGQAVVYTLTVARDHTFFVGYAQVLVHNIDPGGCVYEVDPQNPGVTARVFGPKTSDFERLAHDSSNVMRGEDYISLADMLRNLISAGLHDRHYNPEDIQVVQRNLTTATGDSANGVVLATNDFSNLPDIANSSTIHATDILDAAMDGVSKLQGVQGESGGHFIFANRADTSLTTGATDATNHAEQVVVRYQQKHGVGTPGPDDSQVIGVSNKGGPCTRANYRTGPTCVGILRDTSPPPYPLLIYFGG